MWEKKKKIKSNERWWKKRRTVKEKSDKKRKDIKEKRKKELEYKNEKIDKGVYDTLIGRGKLITAKYKVSKYIFFSLSGYTDWFQTLSDEDVILLTLDSLYTDTEKKKY